MKQKRFMLLGVIVIGLLAAIGLSAMAIVMTQQDIKKPPTNNSTVTLEGRTVCLPHKNKDQPQTLECAAGLEANGVFYALKYRGHEAVKAPQGNVTVTGIYTTPTGDEVYDMVGTVDVTSITQR